MTDIKVTYFKQTYQPEANERYGTGALKQFNKWAKGEGNFRLLQVVDKTMTLGMKRMQYAGRNAGKAAETVRDMFRTGWVMQGFPSMLRVATEGVESIHAWGKTSGNESTRWERRFKTVEDVTEWGAMWGYCASTLSEVVVSKTVAAICRNVADIFDFAGNGATIVRESINIDWMRKTLKTMSEGNEKKYLAEKNYHSMLKLAKAVCSFACGLFGLSCLALGVSGAAVPALVALGLAFVSWAGTCIAIYADFYSSTRGTKIIDFLKPLPPEST